MIHPAIKKISCIIEKISVILILICTCKSRLFWIKINKKHNSYNENAT